MEEKTFNRVFNIVILAGMSIALVLTTIFKLNLTHSGRALLLISAFGSFMGVVSTVLSANGRILTFLFGFLDVALYGAMCLVNWKNGNSGLGNALLHFFYFVPMQFVGFFQWKKRGAHSASSHFKVRRLSGKQRVLYSSVFVAGTIAAYLILAKFDRSAADSFIKVAVILDALPLMCNIIGQLLMSTAYMEQWFFWIGVNVFSILMWTHSLRNSPDSFAAIYIVKYVFYLINSLNGLRIWMNLSKKP